MNENDISKDLQMRVQSAIADNTPLRIFGGGSKDFYGRCNEGQAFDVSGHRGVIGYEPSELVVTARAGTPLSEIEALLAQHNQMLPFEPPHFGPTATLGGCIAAGLAGPRRPWAGAVRDAVLGVVLLNGKGELLRFGGQVMKNVAGYDVSRLMTGSLGTLGVLLELSIKVLPRPAREITLLHETDAASAQQKIVAWSRLPLPLSATLHHGKQLHVRLSGTAEGVKAARERIGGDLIEDDQPWAAVREQRLAYFASDLPLWRLSIPTTAQIELPGDWLSEWGGAQRWLCSDAPAAKIRAAAATAGGHATLFRGHDGSGEPFQPLPPALLRLHQRVKQALDPHGVFNPGRMYAEF